MTDGYRNFTIERDGPLAVLTFTREERLNALDHQTFRDLIAGAADVEGDPAVRAVIVTGRGKGFVAGADINEYVDIALTDYVAFQRLGREAYDRWEALPKPIIAAVNGYALGGGFELVLIADIVVASERAKFGLPECKLGLMPGGGGTQRLTRLVGRNKAKELIMTGDFIDAAEAQRLGVVNRVVPADELLPAAKALAATIAERAPLAVAMAKELVNDGLNASLPAAITMEMGMTATLYASRDAQEGIAAFLEKRPPAFEGR
ncbi:MAG TPA: enoyl-CoA hydratase/isomerase family protein [Thermomicrobiales bacterium]|nr:enoyl-CoA hydratase/isomerase family protein [Thermomicrobiales bacterium]